MTEELKNMHTEEHNALAIAASQNNEAAFTQLYEIYIHEIYGFVMKRIGHKETCEDIVSDVFRKVFLNLKTFDPKKASFRVWVYRIATNTMTDHWRVHRNPNKGIVVDIEEAYELHDETQNPHDDLLSDEQKQFVQNNINKLPNKYQTIVQLKYFDDLPNTDIAEIMGIKPNNVGVLLHRALKKLKGELEQTHA